MSKDRKEVQRINSSLLDEIESALKGKGTFQRELSTQEMRGFIGDVITSLVEAYPVKANIRKLDIRAGGGMGRVTGEVEVRTPVGSASAEVDVTLENKRDWVIGPVGQPRVDINGSNFAVNAAINQLGIKRGVQETLADFNQVAVDALKEQLELRGIHPSSVGFWLTQGGGLLTHVS